MPETCQSTGTGRPFLKGAGLRLVATHHEVVEASFVDEVGSGASVTFHFCPLSLSLI